MNAVPKSSLFERAIKAGVWTLSGHGLEMVTRLLSMLVLTRLLFPEAFGIIAAATSIIVGLGLISDVGIRTIILQSVRGGDDDFLRTAWSLQICRGFALWFALLAFCAVVSIPAVRGLLPPESVFASPTFALVTAAMGLNLAIGGFESPTIHRYVRELRLKPVFLLDVFTRSVSWPIMLLWAWLAPSVWALVAGGLLASIARTVLSHAWLPGPRMAWRWNTGEVKEIIHFGKWIAASSAASFLGGQSDRIVLGILLPAPVFGLYAIARMLMDSLQEIFDRLNSILSLPILSETARHDLGNMRKRYYRYRIPFDMFAPFLGGAIVVTGPLIVSILFDPRYADVGNMLEILAIGLLLYPPLLIGGAFTAIGQPSTSAAMSFVQVATLLCSIFIGYAFLGPIGCLWGIALHKLPAAVFILAKSHERGWLDVLRELRVIPSFLLGLLAGQVTLLAASALGIGIS